MLDILIRGSSRGRNRISYSTTATVVATVLLLVYLFYPTRLPRRNPLANLLFPPTSLSLTFLLTIYIYIATSGDPVTVSIRALSRDAGILRPAGINGNSDFLQVSTILANRPRVDLSEEFICPGSHSLPLSLISFSTNSSLGKTEAPVNESVQFRRSEPRAFEIAL